MVVLATYGRLSCPPIAKIMVAGIIPLYHRQTWEHSLSIPRQTGGPTRLGLSIFSLGSDLNVSSSVSFIFDPYTLHELPFELRVLANIPSFFEKQDLEGKV